MDCRRNPGIDIEAIQKVFDRLEQINQSVVAVNGTLDCLIGLGVTKMRSLESKEDTYGE
jgi:hypothetical protein